MAKWRFDQETLTGGRMQLLITRLTRGGARRDVTSFRGAPTQIGDYSSADPFGDATASFTFPLITGFDDLTSPEIGSWLAYYSNVDLWWLPAEAATGAPGEQPVINPLTQRPDLITPQGGGAVKLWEGFLASMDFTGGENADQLRIECQGANFQLDRYLEKPFYPRRPYPLELLIADAFSHVRRPHLRTQPLEIQWPAGWAKRVPRYAGSPTLYTPVATPGTNWTGYASRATGAWDHALTGFVQDQLSAMLTDAESGVTVGNQWTVLHERSSPAYQPGRKPVLVVRDRFRAPDFAIWYGTPGFTLSVTGDSTQTNNIIYGDGTGLDGTVWRNAAISNDGSRTDYLPLAAARDIYPVLGNPNFDRAAFVSEGYQKYGPGFGQDLAASSAARTLARDQRPGWSGTATLKVDPSAELPRWLVRAGMTMLVRGFAGSGEAGIAFHIASAQASPMDGSLSLTVDTRYRDLLNIEQALVRARDPLTPSKLLQINRASAVIEDVQAPWDYTAGSGYVPRGSKPFFDHNPAADVFPYADWAAQHPPLHFPAFYVRCLADSPSRAARWAGPIPVLTSERGTIRRAEFFASDVYGRRLKVPFHVSFYYVNVTAAAMPRDGQGPSPYIDGAFESVNPRTGQPWPAGNFLAPDPSVVIGWGNRSGGVYQRAGFWPSREADGASPSGLMADESTWTFDNTNNPNYNRLAKPGQKQSASAITLYAMFYCEHTEPVYFMGRLFRQEQGS